MELTKIRKGLRVWITNPQKVPLGELPYGAVQRVHDEFCGQYLLSICVMLDNGSFIGGLQPDDLDYE